MSGVPAQAPGHLTDMLCVICTKVFLLLASVSLLVKTAMENTNGAILRGLVKPKERRAGGGNDELSLARESACRDLQNEMGAVHIAFSFGDNAKSSITVLLTACPASIEVTSHVCVAFDLS